MHRDELTNVLRCSPFRPFRIFTSDGASFDVRHPEMMMVTRRTAIVGVSFGESGSNGQTYPEIDRATTLDLLHITRIEEIVESSE